MNISRTTIHIPLKFHFGPQVKVHFLKYLRNLSKNIAKNMKMKIYRMVYKLYIKFSFLFLTLFLWA